MLNPLLHPICLAKAERVSLHAAWREHIPFGMLLIDLLRPRTFVELGTFLGNSYCAFCHAVQTLGTGTRCFAVDSWTGDDQVGFYGPEILADLRAYHDPRRDSSRAISTAPPASLTTPASICSTSMGITVTIP